MMSRDTSHVTTPYFSLHVKINHIEFVRKETAILFYQLECQILATVTVSQQKLL